MQVDDIDARWRTLSLMGVRSHHRPPSESECRRPGRPDPPAAPAPSLGPKPRARHHILVVDDRADGRETMRKSHARDAVLCGSKRPSLRRIPPAQRGIRVLRPATGTKVHRWIEAQVGQLGRDSDPHRDTHRDAQRDAQRSMMLGKSERSVTLCAIVAH